MNWIIYLAATFFTCIMLAFSPAMAKESRTNSVTETKIMTSAYSFMCKTNIENTVKKLNGVSEAMLDLSNKTLTVKYNHLKISKENIAEAVENLGYKAEIVKETSDIYDELGYKASFRRSISDPSVFDMQPNELEIAK